MGIVLKRRLRELQFAVPFHIDLFIGVDQDIGDGGVLHKGFQRTQPHHLILDLLKESLPLAEVERDTVLIFDQNPLDQFSNLLPERGFIERIDQGEIDHIQEAIVNPGFQFIVFFGDEEAIQFAIRRQGSPVSEGDRFARSIHFSHGGNSLSTFSYLKNLLQKGMLFSFGSPPPSRKTEARDFKFLLTSAAGATAERVFP
jgi:hypothetical protein